MSTISLGSRASSKSALGPPSLKPAGKDLWTMLQDYAEQKSTSQSKNTESTVLVVGSKSGGKSTLIQKLLDRSGDSVPPTHTLDYTFARRTKPNSNTQELVHVWEVGGTNDSSDLISIPVQEQNLHNCLTILVLDLQQKNILDTLERNLSTLATLINSLAINLESRKSKRPGVLRQQALKRYGDNHPDKQAVEPLLIPLMIVGTKYDQFMTFEPERQKVIGKVLRWAAHKYGGSLIFMSKDDVTTVKMFFQHHVFRTAPPVHLFNEDVTKRLVIYAGMDQMEQIKIPSSILSAGGSLKNVTFQHWQKEYGQYFAKESSEAGVVELNTYPEPLIDEELKKLESKRIRSSLQD